MYALVLPCSSSPILLSYKLSHSSSAPPTATSSAILSTIWLRLPCADASDILLHLLLRSARNCSALFHSLVLVFPNAYNFFRTSTKCFLPTNLMFRSRHASIDRWEANVDGCNGHRTPSSCAENATTKNASWQNQLALLR